MPPYDLLIGLDRSHRKTHLHLIDTRTRHRHSATLDPAPESLCAWLLELRQRHPQARVALCLEQPADHLIALLEAYDWLRLYPIDPMSLQNFLTPRANADPTDAHHLADLLLTRPSPLAPRPSPLPLITDN